MSNHPKLLVCMGAGPKSLAVALLADVLRRSGRTSLSLVIVERDAVGANWSGKRGYTDGDFPLDTSPYKDLGFPYRSGYGAKVDHELGHYSFVEYLKEIGEYPDWVNRGETKISHRELAEYLSWAARRIAPEIRIATLTRVIPRGDRVELILKQSGRLLPLVADGLMLTGPGVPKKVGVQDEDSELIFDARDYWMRRGDFRGLDGGRVVVIGGGQSAGTVAASLALENPGLRVDIVNRQGFLCAQSAGFHENDLCTEPGAHWTDLSLAHRREILARINNGVVEASIKQFLDHHPNVRVTRGSVRQVRAVRGRVRVDLGETRPPLDCDRVVVAIGFDPVEQLRRLLPRELSDSEWFRDLAVDHGVDQHFRLPGLGCNIHMPALGGLSQGPGFMLLSCLGAVAARIVSAYQPPQNRPVDGLEARDEVPARESCRNGTSWAKVVDLMNRM